MGFDKDIYNKKNCGCYTITNSHDSVNYTYEYDVLCDLHDTIYKDKIKIEKIENDEIINRFYDKYNNFINNYINDNFTYKTIKDMKNLFKNKFQDENIKITYKKNNNLNINFSIKFNEYSGQCVNKTFNIKKYNKNYIFCN